MRLNLATLVALVTLACTARAGTIITITVDENGNGSYGNTALPYIIGTDPGPGGLSGVLIYSLPFAGLQGDLGLIESGSCGCPLDIIRFNGDGTLIFYSDNVDGADSIGDTPSPPGGSYANYLALAEVGPEGNNGLTYTPTSLDPGWDPSNPTYVFISDGSAVPEPATIGLTAAGLLGGLIAVRRRKRQ